MSNSQLSPSRREGIQVQKYSQQDDPGVKADKSKKICISTDMMRCHCGRDVEGDECLPPVVIPLPVGVEEVGIACLVGVYSDCTSTHGISCECLFVGEGRARTEGVCILIARALYSLVELMRESAFISFEAKTVLPTHPHGTDHNRFGSAFSIIKSRESSTR